DLHNLRNDLTSNLSGNRYAGYANYASFESSESFFSVNVRRPRRNGRGSFFVPLVLSQPATTPASWRSGFADSGGYSAQTTDPRRTWASTNPTTRTASSREGRRSCRSA